MESIPARTLRNDVSAVLRRVESGTALRITVSGRPVAELRPVETRRRWLPWSEFEADRARFTADPALADDLRQLAPDTTDDLPLP